MGDMNRGWERWSNRQAAAVKEKQLQVSGTNLGGGTFWGLCRLLTGLESFDAMLALSEAGDNARVDSTPSPPPRPT